VSSIEQAGYVGQDLETLADLPNYYDWIVEAFRPWLKGHTVEIGAGIGTISKRIVADVDHIDLVEPSVNLPKLMPESLKNNSKVSIFIETLEQRLPKMEDKSCDTVIMVNVLEHIEDDGVALNELNRILKPGGHLLLFVPAMQFLYSKLDREHGHYRRYHLTSLEGLVQKNGFDLCYGRYFDLAGVLPWWLINKVGKRTSFNPRITRLYDRLAIPVTRTIESWIQPPLGKNIILIAERHRW
jgi:SAM-dependent methyltransferase